jgi:hypothetical protein
MGTRQRLRKALNWLNLSTPLGLAVAAGTGCRTMPGPHGLVLAHGYRPALPKAAAFTIGNVVLFRPAAAALAGDPVLLGHEARHSTQYAACLGLPFLPLYGLAALWSLWRTGDPASRNVFERRAGLLAGGYTERPPRSRRRSWRR